MTFFLDAFWRALAYCLLPRVIWLSVLPLVLCVGVTGLLSYFYWESGVAYTHDLLDSWSLTQTLLSLLDKVGLSGLRSMIAPMVLVAMVMPVVVILSLLTVAQIMVPSLVNLVRLRRFAGLQALGTESWVHGVLRSLGWTSLAAVLMLLSLPLWLIPPLGLILPPLIWGWLSYRVMTGDVLASMATQHERAEIFKTQRWPLWGIGVITGYLGAAPTLLWAMGAVSLMLAPVLIIASVWLYTGVFVFSALWFAHFTLAALAQRRGTAPQLVEPPGHPINP